MSYSNGLLPSSSTASPQRGLPGVGYALTNDGNYDIQNKKLTNIKAGTNSGDALRKDQIDSALVGKINTSEAAPTPDPVGGKLVRYTNDDGLVTKRVYVEDQFGDSIILESENQDFDDVSLFIPNLKNYDAIAGRRKSNVLVSSVDNNLTGENHFTKQSSDNKRWK